VLKFDSGDFTAAQVPAREAQRRAQIHEAQSVMIEAMCLIGLGNLKESVFLCERARKLLLLCGAQGGSVDHRVMMNLAEAHLLKSEYVKARSIHAELAQRSWAQQDLYYHAMSLLNLAEIDVLIGAEIIEVHQNLDNAKTTLSTLGVIRSVNQCETILADLSLREGNAMAAKNLFQQCLRTAWGNDPEAASYCLERLGNFSQWTATKINWPYTWTVVYLAQAWKRKDKIALHKALRYAGDVFLDHGDENTAQGLFTVALHGFTYMDIHRGRGECMLRLGDIAKHQGQLVKAAELWKAALPLFEQSSQAQDMAEISTRLAIINQEVECL
jgi:tetratricopeptide (TPR) repeat protein